MVQYLFNIYWPCGIGQESCLRSNSVRMVTTLPHHHLPKVSPEYSAMSVHRLAKDLSPWGLGKESNIDSWTERMIEERPWVWNGNRMRDIHRSHDQIWDTLVSTTTTWRDHLIVLHRLQIIVMVLNCKCADRRKCRNGNKLIAEGAKSLPLLLLQNVWKSPLPAPPAPPSSSSRGDFSSLVLPVITQIDLSLAPISSSAPRHRAEYYANLGNQQSQPTRICTTT